MRLDVRRAGTTARLDDIGIQRALHEEVNRRRGRDLARGRLECTNELATDDLPLRLGVTYRGERRQERRCSVDHMQLNTCRRNEVSLDLFGLTFAQQPVIDEHARQL